MKKNIWCLVEELRSLEGICEERKILALTPEACYKLGRADMQYAIPEDFFDEKELRSGEDLYFHEQLKWFKDFDELFKECIPYCKQEDIRMAYAHYYQLKNFIDSIVMQSQILNRVFRNICPSDVVYIGTAKKDEGCRTIYDLYHNKRTFLLPIVKRICDTLSVPYSLQLDDEAKGHLSKSAPYAATLFKKILKKLHFKSIYYFFKYDKLKGTIVCNKQDRLNILLLHAGCLAMDLLLKDLIHKGAKVFFKDGKEIIRISGIFQKKMLDLDKSDENALTAEIRNGCHIVYERFIANENNFTSWINEKCGMDIADIIRPYFKDFIETICARDFVEVSMLRKFFKKEKIDFVLTRSSSEQGSISSLIAATGERRRVCFQHGWHGINDDFFSVTELDLCDYYFAMLDKAEEQMKAELSKNYLHGLGVFQAPRQLQEVKKRWSGVRRDNNLVMYLPEKLFYGFRAYNAYMYSLPWYFEFQKRIIDFLATRRDYRFIYKYAKGQEWLENSIVPYIHDKGYTNISVRNTHLMDCLGEPGRIIVDCPDTGLYEAASAGIPVLSLRKDVIRIGEITQTFLGRSLQKFYSIDEAVRIIDMFLDSDPEQFKANVGLTEYSVIDILTKIKKGETKNER
ncbi:MAG: hypothetical protein NTY34_00580 [Candidatus Omnitrophica bacterium]|nr:hypothetical protein [Candidatus Omnitrophota bacterium]